jgi:16S rRNA (uracil1498-N3)-methyltransferase
VTAPHFFAPNVDGERVTLFGEDARHAARALRVRAGETITVGDGRGTIVEARVTDVGAVVAGDVVARRIVEAPRPLVAVWQAIPKTGKLDVVVQKLTELGAMEIVPFSARRSVPRWDAHAARRHVERLSSIAREAAKQSRRAWLPIVGTVAALADAPPGALALHESAAMRLRDALPEKAPERLAIVVGPEGGLKDEEISALEASGGSAVSLGPLILRTETAALVALAVVLTRYGLLG